MTIRASFITWWLTRHCRSIGDGVVIMPGARLGRVTEIGAHTYIGRWTVITEAKIGSYVSIADRVTLGAGEHALHACSTHTVFLDDPRAQLLKLPGPIIGDDVWIGVNAVVRRGVTIGIGAVIGANSFVNKDVPPYAIAVGSPARVIGYRFPEVVREALLTSRWWTLPLHEAKILHAQLAARHPEIRCV